MVGPLILLAASVAAPSQPAPAAREGVGAFKPTSTVTARARVSVRVLSGVRFGSGREGDVAGGQRRRAQLSDAQGVRRSAELLEFQ